MTTEDHEMRLKRIEQLRDCPGWTEYMLPRISAALKAKEQDILINEGLSADEVMRLRCEARAYREVLGYTEKDATVSGQTLRRGR